MRAFDADIVTELAKIEARAFWLVKMQFDSAYYFTDCDVDLKYSGDTYQSDQGLNVANVRQGAGFSTDKVTLEFGNVGLWLSSILLNEDVTNDPVIIRYAMFSAEIPVIAGGEGGGGGIFVDGGGVFMDGAGVFASGSYYSLIATPPIIFNGFVTGYKLNERSAVINLSTEFVLWRKKTLRMPTASCPWSFTGTECGYGGSEDWCDQSITRCKALSNYDNFGGRKFVTSAESKKLYWGNRGYAGPR